LRVLRKGSEKIKHKKILQNWGKPGAGDPHRKGGGNKKHYGYAYDEQKKANRGYYGVVKPIPTPNNLSGGEERKVNSINKTHILCRWEYAKKGHFSSL